MKTVYWASTSLVVLMLVVSAYTYFFHKGTIDGVRALGFPDYFRLQLGVLKIVGALILLAPQAPGQLKEWAYAGVALFFLTAVVAHLAHKDPIAISLVNVVFLVLLVVSNVSLHRLTSSL